VLACRNAGDSAVFDDPDEQSQGKRIEFHRNCQSL
jgi:hypothetical protein